MRNSADGVMEPLRKPVKITLGNGKKEIAVSTVLP
jgi:hypothetical protein